MQENKWRETRPCLITGCVHCTLASPLWAFFFPKLIPAWSQDDQTVPRVLKTVALEECRRAVREGEQPQPFSGKNGNVSEWASEQKSTFPLLHSVLTLRPRPGGLCCSALDIWDLCERRLVGRLITAALRLSEDWLGIKHDAECRRARTAVVSLSAPASFSRRQPQAWTATAFTLVPIGLATSQSDFKKVLQLSLMASDVGIPVDRAEDCCSETTCCFLFFVFNFVFLDARTVAVLECWPQDWRSARRDPCILGLRLVFSWS